MLAPTVGLLEGSAPPRRRPLLLERVRKFWAFRSLAASAFGAALDIAVLVALVHWGGMDPVIATAIGVVAGGSVNFVLNKYFAFRDRDPKIGWQAVRYALATGLAFAIYEAVYYTLTKRLGVEYVVAKLVSDILVFNVGGLLLNRYVVFPDRTVLAQEAGRTLACLSLAAAFTGSPAFSAAHRSEALLSAPLHADPRGSAGSPIAISTPPAAAAQPAALRWADGTDAPALEGRPHRLFETAPRRAPDLKRRRRPPRAAA